MNRPAILLAATALLALAACDRSKSDTAEATRETAKPVADGDPGKFELKLPGGFEAKINLPADMGDSNEFDIDGVGLFPGASVRSIAVDAADVRETKTAFVRIGFNAPADAAAVADWYQKQFDENDIKVSRSGETLSGTTDDGNAFTLALESAGAGASRGLLTIADDKNG